MFNLTYENQGNRTFLVYKISPDDVVDSMSLGMLTNNQIPGLAQAVFTQMDHAKYIKYNISAKISVDQLFSKAVNKKRLLGVFRGVVSAMLSAEDYMIDPSTILLDLKYIFADVSTGETVLICLPVTVNENRQAALGDFFRNIMFSTQFDQAENCDYVAKIINYLNSTPVFSVADFKNVLDSLLSGQSSQQHSEVQRPTQKKEAPPSPRSQTDPVAAQVVQPVAQPPKATTPPFPVPPRPVSSAPSVAAAQQANSEEKAISLFYLLQHYNKENAAAYKAQKEMKKAQKNQVQSAPGDGKKSAKKKKQISPENAAPGFAVPGQPVPAVEFAVPNKHNDISPTPYVPPQAVSCLQEPLVEAVPSVRQPISSEAPAPADFGETNYFFDECAEDSETVIMGQEKPSQKLLPHLIRKKNNERIPVDKTVFRLGRDVEFNDYAVVDNKYVGHSHCHIVMRDGEYFIVDDNSKNHTSVNGTVISSGTEVKIAHDYSIKLADEEFEFKLY